MGSSQSRLTEQFANRFEPDGGGYVFRPKLRAAGYLLSAAERDRMVAEFRRRLKWFTWGAATAIVLILTIVIWFFVAQGEDVSTAVIWLAIVGSSAVYLPPFFWLWNAPLRELRGRSPVIQERTKSEARRLAFERLTWGQLGAGALAIAYGLWRVSATTNVFVGWGRLWWVGAAAMVLLVAIQAIRKLLMERRS